MTVTTFSELELDENLLEALQDKGFHSPDSHSGRRYSACARWP